MRDQHHMSSSPVSFNTTPSSGNSVSTLTLNTTAATSATTAYNSTTSSHFATRSTTSLHLRSPTLPLHGQYLSSTDAAGVACREAPRCLQYRPASSSSCPAPPALPSFDCPALSAAAAKTPTPPPRRSRGSSPCSAASCEGSLTQPQPDSKGPCVGGSSNSPQAPVTLPPLQPPPPPQKRFASFSPAKGPGPRVEPPADGVLAGPVELPGSVPIPVKGGRRQRPGNLSISTGSADAMVTASSVTSLHPVITVPCSEADGFPLDKFPTSTSSFSTNRTFSVVPRDSSLFSCASFEVAGDLKSALAASRAEEEASKAESNSSRRSNTAAVSPTPELPQQHQSQTLAPAMVPPGTSAPGSESRLSRCKRMMQVNLAPAFDIKKIEKVSQQAMIGSGGSADSAPDTLSMSIRQQKLGGDGAMRICLPGAECCYYDEGICNAAECHPITKVNDFIYLGTWRDANSMETLKQHNITFVLNCAKEVDHSPENNGNAALQFNFDLGNYDESVLDTVDGDGALLTPHTQKEGEDSNKATSPFVSASIPMSDTQKERLEHNIDAAFFFITLARKRCANVLVHCRRGISRSAAIVIAYLMATQSTGFEETYQAVLAKRSCVSLNLGFHEFLGEAFHPDPKWAHLLHRFEKRDAAHGTTESRRREAPLQAEDAHVAVEEEEEEEPFSPFRKPSTQLFASFGSEEDEASVGGEHEPASPRTRPSRAAPTSSPRSATHQPGLVNDCACASDAEDAEDRSLARRRRCANDEEVASEINDSDCPHQRTANGTSSFPSDCCDAEEEEERGAITPPSDLTCCSCFTNFPATSMGSVGGAGQGGGTGSGSGRHHGKLLGWCTTASSRGSSTTGGCTTVNTSVSQRSSRAPDGCQALSSLRTAQSAHRSMLCLEEEPDAGSGNVKPRH